MGSETLASGKSTWPDHCTHHPCFLQQPCFSTATKGRSQPPSSRVSRATWALRCATPGLVTDTCCWATQVPRSVDTLLIPLLCSDYLHMALAFEVPLEEKRLPVPAPPWAQLSPAVPLSSSDGSYQPQPGMGSSRIQNSRLAPGPSLSRSPLPPPWPLTLLPFQGSPNSSYDSLWGCALPLA